MRIRSRQRRPVIRMSQKHLRRGGFTLVEMLVVLAILGLVVGLVGRRLELFVRLQSQGGPNSDGKSR